MNLVRRHRQAGFTIPMALLLAVLLSIIILAMAQGLRSNSRVQNSFDDMTDTYRAAEMATLGVLGQLTLDGKKTDFPTISTGNAVVEIAVRRRDFGDVISGYYIVAGATSTVHGKRYSTVLHTYARVSNVGEYFAAINGPLSIAYSADLSNAKVYGKDLTFDIGTSGPLTRVLRAEYVGTHTCTPPVGSGFYSSNPGINISDPDNTGVTQPVALTYELLFPQLLDADMQRYQIKAYVDKLPGGKAHVVCDFRGWGDIYPPGYNSNVNPIPNGYPADTYTTSFYTSSAPVKAHQLNNADHVYYCPASWGEMYIQGVVHGQVLFVADNNIHITGNLTVGNTAGDLSNPPTTWLPGSGTSSSTAHQAILMTRKNIFIDPTMAPGSTQKIQALAFAPQGTIIPQTYALTTTEDSLSMQFTGAMILLGTPGFSDVFRAGRTYSYMNSLKTNPPPDLPALSEIYYSLEQTTGVSY